jgi:uncharacterized protein YodC (DUF2158 family)
MRESYHQALWTPARQPHKVAQHHGLMSRAFDKLKMRDRDGLAMVHDDLGGEMADTVKEGDKVQLKSGGPTMMVTSVGESGYMGGGPIHAYVTWFNDKKEVKSDSFPPSILDIVP